MTAAAFAVGLAVRSAVNAHLSLDSAKQAQSMTPTSGSRAAYVRLDTPIHGDQVSTDEAQARLPYLLPQIGYFPGNNEETPSEIWVSPTTMPATERSLALVYPSGIKLIIHQEPQRINFDTFLGEKGSPFVSVKVHGLPGMGAELGDQVLMGGGTWHHPRSVGWQDGTLMFAIYGEYPLDELIKVAGSVH
jgi:hypothetical protein